MSSSLPLRGHQPRSARFTAAVLAVVAGLLATVLAGVLVPLPAGAATGADLDQCANGPLAAPVTCSLDSQWDNGNLNASKAHYGEGDSLPYRLIMTGLTAGEAYTTTIEWDTTKGGKHALDYITTFDRTVTGADPCAGVTGCGGVPDTFPIPADSNVTGAGVAQIPGVLTLFGGTITGISPYTLTGTYAGDSSTSITVTFLASAETAVLAWGGHISTRPDWGMANSAATIPGSPYHTRLIEFDGKGGNQDRSLAAAAVVFPASITIVKDAVPDDAQDFSFATTGGLTPADFVLDDDPNSATPNTQTFSNITAFGTYTVTEAAAAGWALSFGTPVCTVTSPNGGSQTAAASTVTIDLEEGENVTCTFTNTRRPDDEEPCRQAASRKPNPCVEDDDEGPTDVDDLVIEQPAPNAPTGPATDPVTDPGAGVAGDTNHGAPAPEQVLPAEITRPEPAPVSGFLPRTGAGLLGQALLAFALIGAGLVLRLARRRRTAEAQG